MLISDLAVVLNLMAIALLGFILSAFILSFMWLLCGRFVSLYSTSTQKKLIWTWLLGPWVLGLVTMIIYSPIAEKSMLYSPINKLAHWHHLYVFQFNSWHGVTVILFAVFTIGLLIIKGLHIYKQGCVLYSLKHFSISQHPNVSNQKVLIIDSDVPTAFTSGLINPICYLSQGLVNNLTVSELNIVIEHERAHARNRDPLFMLFVVCLSAYYPKKLAQLLIAKYRLMTEHVADHATVLENSAEDVAATIVKVVRLQKYSSTAESGVCFSYFGANDIAQRIKQLLQPTTKCMPLFGPVISLLVMLCITVFAIDASHHFIESIFTHA